MKDSVAHIIDHTNLKAEASAADIERLCREAVENNFKAVCINPYWVSMANRTLTGTTTLVCSVVGFPLGANLSATKAAEAASAITAGASEIDMVANIGALKSGDISVVKADINTVREATHGVTLKLIIEATALTKDELQNVVSAGVETGVDFIKTSTGMHPTGGARVEDVYEILKTIGKAPVGVKAAGVLRSYKLARQLVDAGATRLGTSAGLTILAEEAAAAMVSE